VGEEARQTSRDLKRTFEGDNAVTAKDKDIITRIRTGWSKDPETAKEADDLDVSVENGAVLLKGTVTSAETRTDAVRIAEKTSGVTRVTEEIKVAERVGAGSRD
jgi:osmotically-inducible protein OsmY